MRKLTLIVHTSLDGFIANRNHTLDGFEAGDDNLAFVADLTQSADTMLLGRVSYELLETYWPTAKDRSDATAAAIKYSQWYAKAGKIVVSRTIQEKSSDQLRVISGNFVQQIKQLKQTTGRDIQIYGSSSIAKPLISSGLIDEYWVFVNPVFFGEGLSIFPAMNTTLSLTLQRSHQFPNGEVALHYCTA